MQTYSMLGGISPGFYAILGFIPGIAGVGILIKSGMSRDACYLKYKPPSLGGFVVLTAVFIFALDDVLPLGEWDEWN